MKIKHFVDEAEAVQYVKEQLGISHQEAEKLYCEAGGYNGYPVTFYLGSENDDQFSQCIYKFMKENGLMSLTAQFDD